MTQCSGCSGLCNPVGHECAACRYCAALKLNNKRTPMERFRNEIAKFFLKRKNEIGSKLAMFETQRKYPPISRATVYNYKNIYEACLKSR